MDDAMTAIDFTHLPTGIRGWQEFVALLAGLDDWTERHYLELKSELDVLSKEGIAKLVKFTIGAANRDPSVAATYLDGHAVMVVGIRDGSLVGIQPFEAKDLEQRLNKYCGDPGPAWDYHLLPATTTDRKILVFIVGAPKHGDPIWSCQRDDGSILCDGDIYIRRDGATRKAQHTEIAMLTRRAAAQPTPPMELGVIWDGLIYRPRGGLDGAHRWVARQADELRRAIKKPDSGAALPGSLANLSALTNIAAFSTQDRRSVSEFQQQVQAWQEEAGRAVDAKLTDHIAAMSGVVGSVEIVNLSEIYYENVEIKIHIPGEIEGVEAAHKQSWQPWEIIPRPPLKWGEDNHLQMVRLQAANRYGTPAFNFPKVENRYGVRFENGGSVTISINCREIRPSASIVEEMTMVLLARAPCESPVKASWSLTAKGVDRVLRGVIDIAVVEVDLPKSVEKLFPDDEVARTVD